MTERKFQTGALTLAQVRLIKQALDISVDHPKPGDENNTAFSELADMFADDGEHLIPLDSE